MNSHDNRKFNEGVPNSHKGKAKEKTKGAAEFRQKRLPWIDQLLRFHLVLCKFSFIVLFQDKPLCHQKWTVGQIPYPDQNLAISGDKSLTKNHVSLQTLITEFYLGIANYSIFLVFAGFQASTLLCQLFDICIYKLLVQ